MSYDPAKIERRAMSGLGAVRDASGKVTGLRGYGAVFGKPSLDLGGFIEVIRKGAFARSIAEAGDILALAYHDTSKPLARRSAGTLTLSEDETGLLVDITLADTSLARDVAADVAARNIEGMSFGFSTRKDAWTRGAIGSPDLRELIDVDLFEVSAVTMPAYPDTSLALRSRPQVEPAPQPVPLLTVALMHRVNGLHLRLLDLPT